MTQRQQRLEQGYDIIREVIESLENKLEDKYGGIDYKKVQYLAAAYTLNDYFANELACYPDEEWLEVHPEDEVTEEAELKMLLARE